MSSTRVVPREEIKRRKKWPNILACKWMSLYPPNNPRAGYISPATVEVLLLASPYLYQAAKKLNKKIFPPISTRFNCCNAITKLLKRLIRSMPLAYWKRMPNESKREQGGPCNWLWMNAKKSTCLTFPANLVPL